MNFIYWLTKEIISVDPRINCIMLGNLSDWDSLDPEKSMLKLKDGLGLPIGNLTSQLFSNVYLNPLDQFIKRSLKCKNYGRYVDDAIIISHSKSYLLKQVPMIKDFLKNELGLDLHLGKLRISEVHKGIEFLGVFIKPYRIYTSRKTLSRIE